MVYGWRGMSRELKFLNALNGIPGVGNATLRTLQKKFGSFEIAWNAPESELERAGVAAVPLRSILWKRPSVHPDREMEKLIKASVWLLSEDDEKFPPFLKEIPHAPLLLYGKGIPQWDRTTDLNRCLGVVGTRRPTSYGLEATEKLVYELSAAGLVIVSGLATGIDTRAHQTTLSANGKTIAVLGSGLDEFSVFPPENRGLLRRIVESQGTVISEYAPGTPPLKEHFPQRNRIIAGLSRGVMVIEAREKSGALITARLALEFNRDVFAVPGSIFSSVSQGPHKLIQEGAKLVLSAKDILEEIGIEYTEQQRVDSTNLEEKEKIIFDTLEEPLSVDLIKQKTKFDTALIMTSLSMLELKGFIKNLGNDLYQRS